MYFRISHCEDPAAVCVCVCLSFSLSLSLTIPVYPLTGTGPVLFLMALCVHLLYVLTVEMPDDVLDQFMAQADPEV